MEQISVKKEKFCVAAIFIAIMSLMMRVGYVYFLVGLVNFLNEGKYFLSKKDYTKQFVLEIMSIVPILSYVFLSIVLFMRKRGKVLFVAIALVVVLQLLIGGAYVFVSYSLWYDYAVAAGVGLSHFVIALLALCVLSKLNKSKRVRLWLAVIVINVYVIFYFSNIIYSISNVNLKNKLAVGVIIEQLLWLIVSVLALVFLMKWLFAEVQEGEDEEVSAQKRVKSVVTNSSALAKELRELKNLQEEGLLTEEEYSAKKKQILGL